jgi:hypothetical protein
MKYVRLGFIDQAAFAQVPQADAQRMMEECFAYDDVLRRGGHLLGGASSQHRSGELCFACSNLSV